MSTAAREQVEKVVFDALESLGCERADVSLETTFSQLDLDSLDIAELSQVVEDEFKVVIRGEDIKQIKSVGDLVGTVERVSAG